jgi:hypothetical protein
VAFVSTGDPLFPENADGNREIYRLDVKRAVRGQPNPIVQVTDTQPGVDNLNPNLRAFKGNLLAFDSDGNLTPGRCVGGANDLIACSTNADCADGVCGNPESNREVFLYVHITSIVPGDDGVAVRQLTAAPTGASTVGQSANFSTRSTAFSSTADLIPGSNLDGNREIYRVQRAPDTLVQISDTAEAESAEPAQGARGRIAFASDADFTGTNPDGNTEIYFWTDADPPVYSQAGESMGCANAVPSMDGRGRYAAFHSTCARIETLNNPDQSIYIWDDHRERFLPLVVRGEENAASANAQATKSVNILTYESNLGSITDPAICFLNVRNLLKALEARP